MTALAARLFAPSIFFAALTISGCAAVPDEEVEEWEEVAEQEGALRVCSDAETIEGIDVSYWQEKIDWTKVAAGSTDFAFIRAYYGSEFKDPRFDENWAAAKAAGIPRGAYQYFRPGQDPMKQAQKMIAAIASDPGELPPVLDVESTDGLSATAVRQRMQTWLDAVEVATGAKPIIYSAAFMQNTVGTGFSDYPLWVANYTKLCPLLPNGWTEWKFWQYTDTGKVNGVVGNVDRNEFNGSLDDLLVFAGVNPPVDPDPNDPDPNDPDPNDPDPNDPDPNDPVGPTGLLPPDGSKITTASVTMSCAPFDGGSSYQFEIERYSSTQKKWLAYFAYTTTEPKKTFWPATTSAYRFRVRAAVSGTWSPTSTWSTFAFGNVSIP
jgi:GH25 family lysozyme M1 (1,4-beta-N-acetylmuramidase)